MPLRAMFGKFSVSGVFFMLVGVVVLLGAGCNEQSGANTISRSDITPRTVESPTLAGRSPWSFPTGTSEAEKIEEMRRHLEGIADRAPTTTVLGHLFFRRPLKLTEYDVLRDRYHLQGGSKTSYMALVPGIAVTGQPFPETEELPRADVLRAEFERLAYATEIVSTSTQVNMEFEMLIVYGTTRDLERLWKENPDFVRAIGVSGRHGEMVGTWYPVRSGEPF